MAEAFLTARDSFSCPICLDLLKDTVTIPCGHNFCLGCIKGCWDKDDQKGVYSCPQCRHSFTPRPVLNKNNLIAEMVEKIKMTRLQTTPPAAPLAGSPAGSGDVECDVCTGTKLKAVKSCLVCLLSFCEAHIQPHYESPAYKKHKLVEASVDLQEKICSLHDKLLEVFCRTDRKCICLLCTLDGHRGHNTVSTAAEKTEKQNQLQKNREDCKRKIQQTETYVQQLRQVMENIRHSAQEAVEDSEKVFTELIESIERRRSEVKKLIRAQEKTDLSQAKELLKKLEQEIADLRRRDTELEQLSHMEDPVCFIQKFQSLPAVPTVTNLSSINTKPQFSVEFAKKLVSQMIQLNGFSELEMVNVNRVYTVQTADPKTTREILKCFCKLTLNPFMKSNSLSVSAGNKKVDLSAQNRDYYGMRYPENWCQVLCTEPLSGRCYWEVEISGHVSVAVSYKGSNWQKDGIQSEFGSNNQSWSLECLESGVCFRENQSRRSLKVHPCSSRIGVYVDHSAGILSFYSVSDTMTLLHRVRTTFTQPLYASLGMKEKKSYVQICDVSSVDVSKNSFVE